MVQPLIARDLPCQFRGPACILVTDRAVPTSSQGTQPMKRQMLLLFAVLSLPALPVVAQEAETEDSVPAQSGALPLDEIRTFTAVFAKVKSDYVEDVDRDGPSFPAVIE